MSLKNLFYLLLALPILLVSCDKEPSESPEEPTGRYFLEGRLVLGDVFLPYGDTGVTLLFRSEKGDFFFVLSLQGQQGDTYLKPGIYTGASTYAENSVHLFSTSVIMGGESYYFEGGSGNVFVGGGLDRYVMDITLVDAENRECHFTYEGRINGMSPNGDIPTEPVNMDTELITGYYIPAAYHEYFFTLSDKGYNESGNPEGGASHYVISLWGDAGEVDADGLMTIPEGKYTFNKEYGQVMYTVYDHYSGYKLYSADGYEIQADVKFDACEVDVTADGIVVNAVIGGVEHVVTYNQTPKLPISPTMQ